MEHSRALETQGLDTWVFIIGECLSVSWGSASLDWAGGSASRWGSFVSPASLSGQLCPPGPSSPASCPRWALPGGVLTVMQERVRLPKA